VLTLPESTVVCEHGISIVMTYLNVRKETGLAQKLRNASNSKACQQPKATQAESVKEFVESNRIKYY
jgi:hypothetical protein